MLSTPQLSDSENKSLNICKSKPSKIIRGSGNKKVNQK